MFRIAGNQKALTLILSPILHDPKNPRVTYYPSKHAYGTMTNSRCATESVLLPFGYTEERLDDIVRKNVQGTLYRYGACAGKD